MARVRTEAACWYGEKYYPAGSVFEREPDPKPNPPWPPYLEVLDEDDETPVSGPQSTTVVGAKGLEQRMTEPWSPQREKQPVQKSEDFTGPKKPVKGKAAKK